MRILASRRRRTGIRRCRTSRERGKRAHVVARRVVIADDGNPMTVSPTPFGDAPPPLNYEVPPPRRRVRVGTVLTWIVILGCSAALMIRPRWLDRSGGGTPSAQ